MGSLRYTPDDDIRVHEEGAIRLLCAAFQSHENGLPEWLKNAADAYARENAPERKRVILLVLDSPRGKSRASISCLDLCGMTSQVIENDFRIWADPESSIRGARGGMQVQGGHGNGGKCYMTQMFEDHSEVLAVRNGLRNRYGVVAGSVRFGYIPDKVSGRDEPVADLPTALAEALKPIRCPLATLPPPFHEALAHSEGFTLVSGFAPKGYGSRIPADQLIEALVSHPQMIQSLELCAIFVVVNGTLYNNGAALTLPEISPITGTEVPRTIEVPEALRDPTSEDEVRTRAPGGTPGTLLLRTSDKSMRWSRKGRHNIVFRGTSGYIGYVPVIELDVESAYRDRIYGECSLPTLEPFKQNDRGRLARSPMTRAVEHWISEQVELYAREFEARDRRRHSQQEKDALSLMNEALDKWKNRFLGELLRGMWGPGRVGPPPPPPSLPSGKPARIELSLSHSRSGMGVSFRPTLHFFDGAGRRIRPVPYRWYSEDTNVALVDDDLMLINTFSYGRTRIWAETETGKLASNKAELEVVRIVEIRLTPQDLSLAVGGRASLRAECRLASGDEVVDMYLVWTENNPNVARVSAAGQVFGFSVGQTEVIAADDNCSASSPAIIQVVEGGGRDRGTLPGRGFPLILISEVNADPESGESVTFSREDPPVWQRPQDADRNIWWINSSAPLARLFLDAEKGYGYESREWRMYMVERYADILIQIAFTHGPAEQDTLTANEWLLKWGQHAALIQSAAAEALRGFIETGLLPQV